MLCVLLQSMQVEVLSSRNALHIKTLGLRWASQQMAEEERTE